MIEGRRRLSFHRPSWAMPIPNLSLKFGHSENNINRGARLLRLCVFNWAATNAASMFPRRQLWHLARRTIPYGRADSIPTESAPILSELLRSPPPKKMPKSRRRIDSRLIVLRADYRAILSDLGVLRAKSSLRRVGVRPVGDTL